MVQDPIISSKQQQAFDFFDQGNLAEAEKLHLSILQIQPNNLISLLELCDIYTSANAFEVALSCAKRALKASPNSSLPIGKMGNVFQSSGDLEKAFLCYKQAFELEPNKFSNISNLFQFFCQTGDYNNAEDLVNQVIEGNKAHKLLDIELAIAKTFAKRGKIGKAIEYLVNSTHCDNHHVVNELTNYYFFLARYDSIIGLKSIIVTNKAEAKNYFSLVYLLLSYFLTGNIKKTVHYIELLEGLKTEAAKILGKNDYGVIYNFSNLLKCIIHDLPPELDLSNNKEDRLYIFGDSHSLPCAYRTITLEKKQHCVIPKFIFGCQARHLGNESDLNEFKICFLEHIKSVEANSKVMLLFGEIDTRIEYGIIPYLRKNNISEAKDIASIINDIIESYISFISKTISKYQVDIIVATTPISHQPYRNNDDKELRKLVMDMFNDILVKQLEDNNIKCCNLYNYMLNRHDDEVNGLFHDLFHIKHDVYQQALKKI